MSLSIPLEIELEIIKRLPVKSLIRFMSVCKAWKSLIECSEFVARYRVRPAQPHHLLVKYLVRDRQEVKFVNFVDDDDTFRQQKFAPTFPPILKLLNQSRIIDSSCGLLCFNGFLEREKPTTDTVVLWNPSIGKSVVVVVPNVVHRPFDYVVGFGVCPDTNDPKIVKITYIDDIRKMESISCIPCQVMVFTLSSREWTPSRSNQLPRKSIKFLSYQIVIGQFIYWRAYDRMIVGDEYRNQIMSFDLSTEEFREIDLPDSLADLEPYNMSISRLRESLVVLVHDYDAYEKKICDVWMMEHGDSKTFTKTFTINAPNASVSWTLGFRKNGEPIIELQYDPKDIKTPCALVVYERCSKHIKDLGIRGNWYSFYGSSYTESLLLLDHDDDGHNVRYGVVKRGVLGTATGFCFYLFVKFKFLYEYITRIMARLFLYIYN